MKRFYQLIYQLAGSSTTQGKVARAAVPFAMMRVLRLVPVEWPAALVKSVSILEWVGGLLVLVILLQQKSNSHMEKRNG